MRIKKQETRLILHEHDDDDDDDDDDENLLESPSITSDKIPHNVDYPTVLADTCHILNLIVLYKHLGHAVAQLVEALRYKSKGHGFDSRRCH